MSEKINVQTLYKLLNNTFKIPGITQKFSNVSFKNLIEKNLNIFKFISGSKSEECIELQKKYNALGGKFEYDDNFSYDTSNIYDDINYIKIFIKNIFNVDVETFDPTKVVIESKPLTKEINSSPIPIPSVISESSSGLSDIQKNAFFLAPAQIRVQNEIRQGKIFAFDSKPKSIPILKTIAGSLLILGAITSIFLSIFMLIANGADTTISKDSGSSNWAYDTTWPAMLNFIIGVVFTSSCYNMLNPIFSKKNPNENKKYYLAWQPMLMVGIFIVITIVMQIFTYGNLTIFELLPKMINSSTNANVQFALNAWYVLNIMIFVNIGVIGVVITLANVFNPKYDNQKLESLVKKYIDEMITGAKT